MLKPFLTSIGLRGRFLDDFRRSKRRQASHKSRQEGPKSRQDGPKSAPRAAKRAPRAAKTAPSSTKTPSRGLREPFWLHSRPPGTISEAFWATFRSKFGRMFGGRWLLFLRSSSSSFSFACVRFFVRPTSYSMIFLSVYIFFQDFAAIGPESPERSRKPAREVALGILAYEAPPAQSAEVFFGLFFAMRKKLHFSSYPPRTAEFGVSSR